MFKQPRVPEYRENEGAAKHLKALTLFLKDFCQDVWTACRLTDKGLDGIKYPVTSVNSKTGDVELNAADVGARASDWMPTAAQVGARPSNWMPSAADVGARSDTWMPTAAQVGALASNGTAVNASKLGGNAPSYYMKDFGRYESLWSGNWSSGSITVPNTSNYHIFKIGMSGQGTAVLAVKQSPHIRGIGGYTTDGHVITTYQFTATYSEDEWTLVMCDSIAHNTSAGHGGASTRTITSIVGVI